MTRNCVILRCSLICLLVLAIPVSAQGAGMLGTPPPVGHMVEEIATAELPDDCVTLELDGTPEYFSVDLPLPVFASTSLPAAPSQCMWWLDIVATTSCPDEILVHSASLTGDSTAEVHVSLDWGFGTGTVTVCYYVYALAIRTEPASPVESKSFGEIKAMFR